MTENTHMSVVGDGVLKMYRFLDGVLRQFAMQKADFPHFVSHAWLTSDLLLAGTVNGRLIVMDSADYKREYVIFSDDDQPDSKSVPFSVNAQRRPSSTCLPVPAAKTAKLAPNFKQSKVNEHASNALPLPVSRR